MNKEASIKLSRAKIYLLNKSPFFANLILNTHLWENEEVPTACTDGFDIWYNPKFINDLTDPEVAFLLSHEILHIVSLHPLRRNGRDPERWNIAIDYVVNQILVDSGFSMIDGVLLDEQYHNMSGEEVYRRLPENPQKGSKQLSGGFGEVIDAPKNPDGSAKDIAQVEADIKMKVTQAAQLAKMAGKLPAGLERFANEIIEPAVNWRSVLQRFLTEVQHNDYTFSKPNTRYLHTGFYLPTLYNETLSDIYLFVDTSGSISEEDLNVFASEMQDIIAQFGKGFTVLYIDSRVAGEQYIEPDEDLKLEPKGGGGTSFSAGMYYLEEQGIEPKAVVYFTDGYSDDFAPEPEYPLIWCIHNGSKDFQAPYGEIIHID